MQAQQQLEVIHLEQICHNLAFGVAMTHKLLHVMPTFQT
jgi:hypothetical protein